MLPKRKTKIRNAKRIHFQIRKIANRNPRYTRKLNSIQAKIKKAMVGLVLFCAFASGWMIGDSFLLQSDIVDIEGSFEEVNSSNWESNEESVDKNAIKLIESIEELNGDLIELDKKYVDTFEDFERCEGKKVCRPAEKLYEIESDIYAKLQQIELLEARRVAVKNKLIYSIAQLEDEVLYCIDKEACEKAQKELMQAREYEKEMQSAGILAKANEEISQKYRIVDARSSANLDKNGILRLMDSLVKNRIRTDEFRALYQACLETNGVLSGECEEEAKDYNASIDAEGDDMSKLSDAKKNLEAELQIIKADIANLKQASSDVNNLEIGKGLGWCEKEKAEKGETLKTTLNLATPQKQAYMEANANLEVKKELIRNPPKEEKHASGEGGFFQKILMFLRIFRIL